MRLIRLNILKEAIDTFGDSQMIWNAERKESIVSMIDLRLPSWLIII